VSSATRTQRAITHVVAATNPERREGFERAGYRAVAPEFFDHEKQLPVLPMVLELGSLTDRFIHFIQRQKIDHWMYAFDGQFHVAGERVVRCGEAGDAAYVVVDGIAEVRFPGGQRPAVELGPGDMFGELALLTSGPRSADVVAKSDLDLMVLERQTFLRELRKWPETAERMLELVANRMVALLEQPPQ
jgi:hypothetical protein